MNALPKQVQQQADEIARMEAEMEAQQLAETQPPNAVDTQAEDNQPTSVQPVEVVEPPKTPPETTWEARYRTLKGKYDAEIPRLNSQVRDLTTKVESIAAKPNKTETSTERLVTEADVDAFGSDLIDVIDRKAREVARDMVSSRVAELEAENATLKNQVGDVAEKQTTSERRTYFAELAKSVPDYDDLNVDEEFLMWLDEVDPMSGYPRQAYLNDAFEKLDVSRTAHVFNVFKGVKAPTAPPVKPQRQQLERQVAPDKSGNSSPVTSSASARVWTNAEISRFYSAASKGAYRDNPAEQVRIEAEIDQAVIDGRIR